MDDKECDASFLSISAAGYSTSELFKVMLLLLLHGVGVVFSASVY